MNQDGRGARKPRLGGDIDLAQAVRLTQLGQTLAQQQCLADAVELRRKQTEFDALGEAALEHYKRTGIAHSADEDLDVAQRAIDEIRDACGASLNKAPFSYQRTGESSLRRERINPFGSAGYVAGYEIEPASLRVIAVAVRHQREDDYH